MAQLQHLVDTSPLERLKEELTLDEDFTQMHRERFLKWMRIKTKATAQVLLEQGFDEDKILAALTEMHAEHSKAWKEAAAKKRAQR